MLAVAAVVALAVALTGAGSRVDGPFLVNPPGLIDAHNSPVVVRHPGEADTLVVVTRQDRPGFDALVNVTTDGGRTWVTARPPLPEGLDRPFAPDAGFAPDGTLHVVYSNLTGPGNVPENLWLASSDDLGGSWSGPVRVAGAHPFQPRLAIDPDTGDIHVTWLAAEALGLLRFEEPLPRIVTARSTDGGRSFGVPVTVSDENRLRVGAGAPIVDGGRLVVIYLDYEDDRSDFESLPGPVHDGTFTLVAARQTDEGFVSSVIDDRLRPVDRFLVFLPEFPSVARSPDGTISVAWSDGRTGDRDVYLARSADGDAWTDAMRVNDNPEGDGTSQYLPQIDVAPDGRIGVLYLDRRDDLADVLTGASLARSSDGGASFDRVALSTVLFDSGLGPRAAPFLDPDFGSRLGLDIGRESTFAAWADTQLGSDATGRQDVVAAIVRPPERNPVILLVLAAGLLTAGGGLFFWSSRR